MISPWFSHFLSTQYISKAWTSAPPIVVSFGAIGDSKLSLTPTGRHHRDVACHQPPATLPSLHPHRHRQPPSCVRRCPVWPRCLLRALPRSAPNPRIPEACASSFTIPAPGPTPLFPPGECASDRKAWRASPPLLSSPIPAGSGAAVCSSSLSPSSSSTSRTITSVSWGRRSRPASTDLLVSVLAS